MKKAALGIIALAMSFMATTAHAATGDIRSIFPCDMYGNQIDPGSMATAKIAGETVCFCVRLENADSALCYNNNAQNPWMLKYSGMYSLETAMLLTPPAVGVYVSGRLTAAKVISMAAPADKPWYTDIICSYTVKPGDMAFPMTLALANGKEVGSSADPQYLFDTVPMSYSWSLYSYSHASYADGVWGEVIATNKCTFAFGDSSVFNTGAYSDEINSWVKDPDLRKAGLYIKTVDFAAEENTVPEGRTEKVLVNINGGVNTNGIGVVYAMVRDDAPVSLAESGVETVEFPDSTNPEMAGTYQVAAVTIPSGADVSSFSFKVMGEMKSNDPVTVYLATTKGFVLDGGGKNMITNFITTSVRCVSPPPPHISVTLDGNANKSITSGADYVNYAAKLTVALSEAYGSDVTVEVTPSMISGSGTDPFGRYIGMSTYSENGFTESTKTVTFTAAEMAEGTLSKDLYVYVLGADDDTDGIGKGIEFKPKATGSAADYFGHENIKAILYIKKSTPQILYPIENYEYSGLAGGVNSTFTIKIADDYSNMQSDFTVEWLKTGSGSPQTFTVKPPYSNGEAVVSVRYNSGEYTTRFRVKNASGVYSEYRTVKVQVNPAKQVSAVVEDPDDSGEYNETEEEISLRFYLTEAFEDATLYAFLVPMDAASSNLVSCKAFENGIAIKSGDTNSTATAKIQLLDGNEDTLPLTYSIVLRTAKTWASGETIGTYESKDLEIYIHNVPPAVVEVNMSGSAPVTASGSTFAGKASKGLNKIFTLVADDVEADLTGAVTSVWTFSDPNGNAITRTVTGPVDDIVLTNVFEVAGTYSCTVKLQDKDMSSKKYGETFAFNVVVLDTPSVAITFPNSNTFNETDADKGLSYFNVELSTAATKPVEVEIECTQIGADGVLNIATNLVTFRAGQMQQKVLIDELDGTANSASFKGGFSVTARVVTEDKNEDGIKYSAVYLPATEKMYVANEPPQIVVPFETGATNDAAINVYIPIKWKIDDVDADRMNNLTVSWTTSEGRVQEFKGNDVFEGVFTNIFTAGGAKTVTMTVTDKDDGVSSITLYYKVSPSKAVNVLPFGPYMSGANTEISKKYASSIGIGEGRVEGQGGSPLIEYFAHKYSFGFSDTTASLKAWGYKNGQVDGTINEAGHSFKEGDTPYCYSDPRGRDSFFYAWVVASKEEEATTYTGTPVVSPLPPSAGNRFASYTLSLPTEQAGTDANPVFADRLVEVFFSKELYPQDNMGDMNADGIPDYFATMSWSLLDGSAMSIAEAMTGVAISGGESKGGEGEEEGESASASDLTDVSAYNGDLDFFPLAWTSGNPLNPAIQSWAPGLPFTAYDEIRGIGEGLNQPGVSEYMLTEAERFALLADYAAAGNAITGTAEDDYAAATNWAASVGWTPEAVDPNTGARLNPLKADTDGDGFDDGWEYFFWYHAKIGAVVNGTWGRLEGRRFALGSTKHIVRISPEEIAKAFDPLKKRALNEPFGSDFDNDGLTDFEEYILGTNPVSCDLGNDGVIELYKVMNGIDPNSAFNNDGNPDCDFMARCDYAEDTFTVYTFENGEMYALPSATGSSAVLEPFGATAEVFKVEFAAGDTAWFLQKPVTVAGAKAGTLMLATDVVGYTAFESDGVEYLGGEKVFSVGSVVKSVAEEAVAMTQAAATGFAWTDPATLQAATTTMALPLFNYGGDGATYVPCVTNVTTYALAPSDSALVKVEQDKTVTLIHNQVFCQYGFDPRTAWNVDRYGYVDQRWRKEDSLESEGYNAAGLATNTVPFTTRDEFLVMQYRQQMLAVGKDGKRQSNKSLLHNGDGYLLENFGTAWNVPYIQATTTYPNLPVSFVRAWYATRQEVSPFENSTNTTIVSYWTYLEQEHDVHGADTDFDGIPDGWELYVNSDPTFTDDGKLRDDWAKDGDKLSLLEEYAGVDSCNAYTNRFSESDPSIMVYPEATTITRNHPGKDKGWWNKFFPTNPIDMDTDGDGVQDDAEGGNWNGIFNVGNTWYGAVPMTFIYGNETNAEKYSADGSSVCFRGGGLNPCTVDTDGDLLPDAWEFQFAGIVFENGETTVPLSATDLAAITAADGKQKALEAGSAATIRGGMDGTFKDDACYDFDHDGLANCQEYLVQSLRHLRYDDSFTPLMGLDPSSRKFIRFMPFSAWDGEAFHKRCLEAGFTGLATWKFRELGYFALPPHEWDMLRQTKKGISACANYADSEGAGYRVMLPPLAYLDGGKTYELWVNGAKQYATTDPRRVDSDYDGMDDYWELFHGLNPLLGSTANPFDSGEYGWLNSQYDLIAEIHGNQVNSWYNHWTGWDYANQPKLDAIKHPWMIGTMECDADGDGLRNDEEALKVNLAKPRNTHTDPTPLWMTDSSGEASFTAQYYNPDPYITGYTGSILDTYPDLLKYPWSDLTVDVRLAADGMGGISLNWMFAFEENEGYDTDHDFRKDSTELTRGVEMASDPLNHTDLDRRQALYFPGWDGTYNAGSAAVSYGGEFRRSPSTEPDLLKQFTVECWVKPDGEQRDVTILERVCNYGASTLTHGDNVIRANFRIGIDANGCAYGEFQGSTADSTTARVTSPLALAANAWTHIAFRFDGQDAHLHINGEAAPVASAKDVGILPANGIDGIQQTPDQTVIALTGYRALPCATVLGASITGSAGFELGEETSWSDFGMYYKGWIDEVRIWDGARTSAEIANSYKKRFSMDDIKALRSNENGTGVYDMWIADARRWGSGAMALPAELLQHYNFSTLPGGAEPGNVITEPVGFRAGVLDNVRKPSGESLDLQTMVGWWYGTPVHSLVYWDYHLVPWIANTVAHLPFMDGSAPDSQFWAEGIAGVSPATTMGVSFYEFPNAANPYPYYNYRRDRFNRLSLLGAVESLGSNSVSYASLYGKWLFELRSGFVGTSDLVPLGLAYAKRDADYWDGQGAMDAWTQTKVSAFGASDSDGNGIPDWAEKLGFNTAEAYLRALAEGLVPADGFQVFNEDFKSSVDTNFDGVPDWWQKQYGIAASSQDDTDKDGLADYAEYLISGVFNFDGSGDISPLLPKSNGKEFDYFRKVGRLYYGLMFTDHDFMEDHLEREYAGIGAQPAYYDAHTDRDENGWSAWADLRSKYDMGYEVAMSGEVKTNVIYQTYVCYEHYKSELETVLDDASGYELIETDFSIQGKGHWFTDDGGATWHDDFFGTGFIKYYVFTPIYSKVHMYKGHPVPEVRMTVRYNGISAFAGNVLSVEAYTDPDMKRPDAKFIVRNGSDRSVNALTFKHPDSGYLREGKNTFVVSMLGAATNATAGTVPVMMGVVRDVDVGWDKAEFDVELTETTPVCPRFVLPAASTNAGTRMYVYRYSVDGLLTPPSTLDKGPVLEKDIDGRMFVHEGDFLGRDGFDIDWAGFGESVLDNMTVIAGRLSVTSVTYRVVFGEAGYSTDLTNMVPYVDIVRTFDKDRAKPVAVSPGNDSTVLYSARPKFSWKIDGDSYTAFAIQVKSGSTVVWNSGKQLLPPKNTFGEYEWTAPLYVGDMTALGHVFASMENYTWSVSMYNSKFQSDSWSDERAFRVNVYGEKEVNNTGRYGLKANVKYFGPAELGSAPASAGIIRVEAYASPDFSGEPAGRAFVRNGADAAGDSGADVVIYGLKAGAYYVRAFIDSDGDNARSNWESWGYVCSRGDTDAEAIYAPVAVAVGEGIETPLAAVYIEDADTDQDCLPDAWEYDESDGSDGFLLKKGPAENTEHGYISVNPDLEDSIKRVVAANGGSGLLSYGAAGSMAVPFDIVALSLGIDTAENTLEATTLAIKAISLADGAVNLTVGAAANEPDLGTLYVKDNTVTATVVISYSDSLDGEWNEKDFVKTFEITDGSVGCVLTITKEELEKQCLDTSKGFFKVRLK